MVDHATIIVALFDGTAGGTANCMAYARSKRVPIENLWSRRAA
jgi:hypothetical protein